MLVEGAATLDESTDELDAGDLVIKQKIGCRYFPPGPRLPSQPLSISASTDARCLATKVHSC